MYRLALGLRCLVDREMHMRGPCNIRLFHPSMLGVGCGCLLGWLVIRLLFGLKKLNSAVVQGLGLVEVFTWWWVPSLRLFVSVLRDF